jgi:hypothetical protein
MKSTTILLFFTLILTFCSNSFGDRRYFGWSYTANTLPQGAFELEVWNTWSIGKEMGYYYQFQPRFEFEYGVLDRLTASLYFNFDQITTEGNFFRPKSFTFNSTSIELRYRFTDQNEILIDPALYFEFAYGGDEIEYEAKTLLSKRINNLITVLNINSEIEREIIESETESIFEITAGAMYEIIPSLALGIEFRNHREYEEIYEEEEYQASFLGPTLNLQTKSFYLTMSFLPQIGGSPATSGNLELMGHEKYEFRTILGIDL